jgi:hypothetical protein
MGTRARLCGWLPYFVGAALRGGPDNEEEQGGHEGPPLHVEYHLEGGTKRRARRVASVAGSPSSVGRLGRPRFELPV